MKNKNSQLTVLLRLLICGKKKFVIIYNFKDKGSFLSMFLYIQKGGLDESSPYIGKTKSIQFIDIFKKVGLMNQAPTGEIKHLRKMKKAPT